MARLKFEIHPEAALELGRSYEYYASRSLIAADAFLDEIDAAFEGIAENPSLWPQYLKQYRRRVLTRFPFSVVYRVVDDGLEVVGIVHDKKRPGYWESR
ncbi:MAG: type II toxin-antitoxin system RelE/ParE family toxin [Rhodothermales bacterium]